MKKKIQEALSAEYKGLGLSEKTIGRLADYIVSKGSVTKEEEIDAAVKGDDVKLLATSIQGEVAGLQRAKETAEAALEDYKAKHPEKSGEDDDDNKGGQGDNKPMNADQLAKIVKDAATAAATEAVKAVKDEFDAYKAQNSAKEAVENAKKAFYGNKWTTKFKEEADDAWDRVHELNEAKGGTMTEQEISEKATEYFNAAVKRKGVDTTKQFEEGDEHDGNFDFSEHKKHLQEIGKLPEDKKE